MPPEADVPDIFYEYLLFWGLNVDFRLYRLANRLHVCASETRCLATEPERWLKLRALGLVDIIHIHDVCICLWVDITRARLDILWHYVHELIHFSTASHHMMT